MGSSLTRLMYDSKWRKLGAQLLCFGFVIVLLVFEAGSLAGP